MKKDWEIKRLGDVCDYEKTPNRNSSLPYVGLENIESNSGKFIGTTNAKSVKSLTFHFTDEHILYGRLRPYLNKVLSPSSEGQCSTEIFPIKPKIHLSRGFLFHWLLSSVTVKRINATCTGTRMPRANMNKVLGFEIPVPPLPEQQRIVAILDEAFAAIATAKENAQKNLQNACELFESYLHSIFANPGDGWEEKRLGDNNLLKIIDGDRGKNYPKKSDFLEEGYCLFMNTKNVRPDGFDFETTMFINERKANALGQGKLKRNDVVMTTRGTIGNLGIYSDDVDYENIRINSGMLIFRPDVEIIMPEYLFEVLRSGIIKTQIAKHVSGAAQPQLPIKTLVHFTLPVPKSLFEQHAIVTKLDVLFAETKKLESSYQQKLAALDELKKSLLHQAFTGEL
jgi:type I restriction enzyme S subunit